MLFLSFQLGQDRYALQATQVIEVLPMVHFKKIPQAPPGVAGIFNYRGSPVPVIDLSELASGRPAELRLNTRIIVVNYSDSGGEKRPLGLIAERATETLERKPADFVSTGITLGAAPYLGPVATDAQGLIQWVEVNKLLPAGVRDLLFNPSASPAEATL